MKSEIDPVLESYRVRVGPSATSPGQYPGVYFVLGPDTDYLFLRLTVVDGWVHLSMAVYRMRRYPTQAEIDFVRGLVWERDEVVVQFHTGRQAESKQRGQLVLHLWQSLNNSIPCPPAELTASIPPRGIQDTAAVYGC